MLAYRIDATRPESRELDIRLALDPRAVPGRRAESGAGSIELFLPTWTPGSYLVREYARHLSRVVASDAASGRELDCLKVAKNRYRVEAGDAARIEVRYQVYAHELSVRTADLDATHAFWNHACVLLWPVGWRDAEARITIHHRSQWTMACSLACESKAPGQDSNEPDSGHRTVTLRALDLDEALDAPVLIGELHRLDWQVEGIPHAIVLDGMSGIEPPKSLVEDLTRIVHCAAAVFGGVIPYPHYVFLALFAAEGHGGLEHRNSSTLLMPRTAFADARSYREFLGLAAHELFHAWNVKRMRPAELWNYDYEQENYTSLLWLMEGWTAYYDDLLVARAGLMTPEDYLAAMAKNVQAMLATPGRWQLSLEESSFDAWIRLYRPDENTRNSSQNYYGNGAVAAMCLDLLIRRSTSGSRSLDDVLQQLFDTTFANDRGYTKQDVERVLTEIAGAQLVTELRALVSKPLDPELDELLADVGVRLQRLDQDRPYLGVVFRCGSTVLSSVNAGAAGFAAGMAPGDEVLAVRGLRVTADTWQTVFRAVAKVDEALEVLVARRGVITTLIATPTRGIGMVQLQLDDAASPQQQASRASWLHSKP